MKFYCDSCNTKYAIADEKVRGKVLKVRCKKCENVITVREQKAPVAKPAAAGAGLSMPIRPVPPSPAGAPFEPARAAWHYSLNGQSFGPFGFAKLEARFANGELGDECYVWTDGFSSWKPVGEVEAFAGALKEGRQAKPRQQTLAASQAVEAIQAEDIERAHDNHQKDRLAKLRARLNSPPSVDESALAADGGSKQPAAEAPKEQAQPAPEKRADEALEEEADPLGPTLPVQDLQADQVRPADEDLDADEHSGLFDDFDAASPQTFERDDALAEENADDSDRVPFLSDGPELSSTPNKVSKKSDGNSGVSGSLLIQLDKIQKEGRGKKALLVALGVAIVGGLTATALYLADQVAPEQKASSQTVQAQASDQNDELVFRTYSNEEQNRILLLGDQREAEEAAGGEQIDGQKVADEPTPSQQRAGAASKQDSAASKEGARRTEERQEAAELQNAFNSATKKAAERDTFRDRADNGAAAKSNMDSPIVKTGPSLKTASATQSERNDPVYNPTDTLKKREKAGAAETELSRAQINTGMNTIRRSVGLCRQRHSRRGQPLEVRKIYLTLTVEPTGRVSNFELAPDRIQHTEFSRCMNSHKPRWKFPSFNGTPQKMRAPVVLD